MKISLQAVLLFVLVTVLSACTSVKAWERADLAREEMFWQPDPMASVLKSHVHFSKEGSSGGGDAAGGGCGCN